jgi:hypothetical protein
MTNKKSNSKGKGKSAKQILFEEDKEEKQR